MRFVNKLPLLILLVCSFGTIARADTLNISGTFALTPIGVDFGANGFGVNGNFDVTSSGGVFSVPSGVGVGAARDLNFVATTPLGTSFTFSPFLTFNANPNLRVDLTSILFGASPQTACGLAPAPNQACTPLFPGLVTATNPTGLSPYNFTNNNTATESNLSFTVLGNVVNGATSTPVTGIFSVTFSVPYQTILSQLNTNGTTGPINYSAIFITTNPAVPEPTTILLLGTSLVGVAAKLKKRRKR